MTLPDDQGAKKIIQQHLQDVSLVDFPGGEVDLDTPEDYQRFIQERENKKATP
jgi:molybdenum cofactor cytidylyltransferase